MIEDWKCEDCRFYNDILTNYCRICHVYKPFWLTCEYQALVEIKRGIYFNYGIYGVTVMTDQEELFAKFYNQEKLLVKDMDSVQLREHRDELSTIAFEAKARLVATDDEARERNKSSKSKEWILPVDNSQVDSDAVSAVKVRAGRMNKIEKLRSQLLAAGIDEDTVKEMVKNLERKATEKDMKAIVFNKPSTEQAVVMVDVTKSNNGEPKEPFNPASLFGAK
jgi:hypothetical protein